MRLGIKKVKALQGGWNLWRETGGRVETSTVPR
jgi:3-mercaptopyruvate sulfurtransferase SseA